MMNDLVLSEDGHAMPADEYHDNEDYYETQTGEDITGARRMRPRRGNYGKYMVVFGGILILGGIILGFAGGDIDAIKAHNDLKNQLNPPTPSPRPPTAAPTMAPTSFEDGVLDILTQSVDKKVLLDDDSYAFNAYTWLMKNADIRQYSTNQIRQRFALASIYYGTNEDLLSWKKDDSWITDSDECSWFGVKCDKEGKGHIVALNLTGNGLQGNFPNEITMLKNHLMSLEIGINNLFNHGKDLAWMADLKELKVLDVEDTYMSSNGIPSYIGKLTNLRILDVAKTDFSGELKGEVFEDLTDLIYLDIGGVVFNSTIPEQIPKLPKLNAFYAYRSGMKGKLDNSLPHFKNIKELWLDNNAFTGTIPPEIGNLSHMASLSLSDNALTGSIPTEIGKLTKMEQMWVYGNWLEGDIPSEIGKMTFLRIMGVEDNNMQGGKMPDEICSLNLIALGADCADSDEVACSCCTCCETSCPVASLPLIDSSNAHRLLFEDF